MKRRIQIAFALALTISGAARGRAAEHFVGLSHGFDEGKDVVIEGLETLVTEALPMGDQLTIVDAKTLQTIEAFAIPAEGKAYRHAKFRKKAFRKQLRTVRTYIEELPDSGAGGLDVPLFLGHVGTKLAPAPDGDGVRARVLVIGNALHQDPKEPDFDMREGYFPSDAHIEAPIQSSPYGTAGKEGFLDGIDVHFLYTNPSDSWASSLYRDRIERFWTLFVGAQGGSLATFTPDRDTAYRRLVSPPTAVLARHTLDHTATKLEMLYAGRGNDEPSTPDPVQRLVQGTAFLEDDVPITTEAPTATTGRKVKVGIRWPAGIDLDVYARASRGQPYLYFGQVRTDEGRFFRDWTSAPDQNGLEYIEFDRIEDIRTLEVMVNFYSGHAPGGPSGVVRVFLNGKVYEGPFRIAAERGNQGGDTRSTRTSPHWQVLDMSEVLGFAGSTVTTAEAR